MDDRLTVIMIITAAVFFLGSAFFAGYITCLLLTDRECAIDDVPDTSFCVWADEEDATLAVVPDGCQEHESGEACIFTASDGRRLMCVSGIEASEE